ncbi:MAG: hypothetical protein HOH89_01000, partial [Alphaproteobacteria bacterium]|nr:hypothetical protein [Alphaproteobacteria bacterium]
MSKERIFLWALGVVLMGGVTVISIQAMLSKPYDGIASLAFAADDF